MSRRALRHSEAQCSISAVRLVLPAIVPSFLVACPEMPLEVVAPRSFDATAIHRAALQADERTVPVASRDNYAAPTDWHRLAFHSCRRLICPRLSRSRIVRRAKPTFSYRRAGVIAQRCVGSSSRCAAMTSSSSAPLGGCPNVAARPLG